MYYHNKRGCTLNRIDRLNSINAFFYFGHRKRGILIGKIKSSITNIPKENDPIDNNTRKLLNSTDGSLILNENWLSREARNNRSFNMMTGRLVNKDKQCQKCGCYQSVKNGTHQIVNYLQLNVAQLI